MTAVAAAGAVGDGEHTTYVPFAPQPPPQVQVQPQPQPHLVRHAPPPLAAQVAAVDDDDDDDVSRCTVDTLNDGDYRNHEEEGPTQQQPGHRGGGRSLLFTQQHNHDGEDNDDSSNHRNYRTPEPPADPEATAAEAAAARFRPLIVVGLVGGHLLHTKKTAHEALLRHLQWEQEQREERERFRRAQVRSHNCCAFLSCFFCPLHIGPT
jgi:hypothetical protein